MYIFSWRNNGNDIAGVRVSRSTVYLRIYFHGRIAPFLSLKSLSTHTVETFQGGRKSQPFTARIYIWLYARG